MNTISWIDIESASPWAFSDWMNNDHIEEEYHRIREEQDELFDLLSGRLHLFFRVPPT